MIRRRNNCCSSTGNASNRDIRTGSGSDRPNAQLLVSRVSVRKDCSLTVEQKNTAAVVGDYSFLNLTRYSGVSPVMELPSTAQVTLSTI